MPHMVWARTRLYLSVPVYLPRELEEKNIVASALLKYVPREDGNDSSLAWIMCTCLSVDCTGEHTNTVPVCAVSCCCVTWCFYPCPWAARALTGAGALSLSCRASWAAWDTLAWWVCLKDDNPFSYPGATWCFLHMPLQSCWLNSFRP